MVRSRGAEIDVCPHCHGIWFDHGELVDFVKKLSESPKIKPKERVRSERRDAGRSSHRGLKPRACPRCDTEMRVFNYAYDSNVYLDRCPDCTGVGTVLESKYIVTRDKKRACRRVRLKGIIDQGVSFARVRFFPLVRMSP